MTMDPRTETRLRQAFKVFNRFMLLMWRLGLGRWFEVWPAVSGRVMVLVHTGRKTGLRRTTPVNYAEVDGELYCTAGFGAVSDWYRNILAHPEIEVWLPDGWWRALATDISADPQRLFLMRQVLIGSGFAAYAAGLNPQALSDAGLEAATSNYRLLRIQRLSPMSGPGGPGDLAWVWPLVALLLGPLFMLWVYQRLKKKYQEE